MAPAVPSFSAGAASDPEGAFMLAAVVDPGKETSSGGLDKGSATTFLDPATCTKSAVYSAM